MAEHDVDLLVIGAGSGGVRAARIAAGYGASVMVAEEYRVGGTCVIRGCIPKKLLVYASRFADEFEDAAGYGWTLGEPVFDWSSLVANKDREIARLELAYTTTLERARVKLVRSRAVLEDAHTVRLVATGEKIRPRHILIATGAAPWFGPAIPGIEHVISSNEAFHLEELPARILIQGGSYIAVEFASIFNGLGSDVTLVYRAENILRGFDDDLRAHLNAEMTKRGVRILCGTTVRAVQRTQDTFIARLSDDSSVEVDKVMFALGRWPNVGNLGLDAAGVRFTPNRGIAVDPLSQTSVPHIHAIGDVTNRVNLTPVAIREGHAFADTVFGGKPTAVDHINVPTAVFSEPEVGTVGMTEEEAVASLGRVDIYKTTSRPMKATLSGSRSKSLMKRVVDGRTGRVVGWHIVGPDAGELIQIIAIAVQMRASKSDFDAVWAVHPTAAEELVMMRQPILQHGIEPAAA